MAPKAVSKTAPAKVPSHPPWVEMIKECIAAHREDARIGVSRPQIKKFVETTYNLELGPAQVTQLNKAISNGADKGTFYLPKGLSGRVKLPPKTVAKNGDTDTKENKPVKASRATSTKKAPVKASSRSRSGATTTRATKSSTAKKPATKKDTATKEAKGTTKKSTVKKEAKEPKVAAKPVKRGSRLKSNDRKPLKPASKSTAKAATTKKTTSSSRRDTAKKEVTGKKPASRTPASKAKKSPESKAKAATKTAAKPTSKQASKPASATKRKSTARK